MTRRVTVAVDGQKLYDNADPARTEYDPWTTFVRQQGELHVPPSGGDDTARLQRALDLADGSPQTPTVRLAGAYRLSDTLNLGRATLDGGWPETGSVVRWDGPNDRPALVRPRDGLSYGRLHGLKFMPGTGEPSYWLDLTARYVDSLFVLDGIQFAGGLDGAIKMVGWVNLHWRTLRFDNVGGYAIDAAPPAGQNLSTFKIGPFTYDHSRDDQAGRGVLRIDNTALASNLGPVTLRDGRIEVNRPWASPGAIFTVSYHGGSCHSRAAGLTLEGVTYQDVSGMAGDVLVDRDTPHEGSESVLVTGSRFEQLSAFGAGPWNRATPTLPTNVHLLDYNANV